MRTILITGVSGFVGPYAVRVFRDAGWEVRGMDVNDSRVCPTTPCDIRDAEKVQTIVQDIQPQAILHLAGFSSVAKSWEHEAEVFAINVDGTRHLLEAASHLNEPPRILLVSSGELYGKTEHHGARESEPIFGDSPYARSRVEQEKLIDEFPELPVVVSRSFNHTGPGEQPVKAIPAFASQIARIERKEIPPVMKVGNLSASRDILDVRDVIVAYRLLVEQGRSHETYNVASGTPRRIGDVLKLLLSFSSVSITVETDPARIRPEDCPIRYGDPSKIVTETGWRPRISLEHTLRDVLQYWRENV